MAKNPHPFSCDECSQPKRPSNGWFLMFSDTQVNIMKWDNEKAEIMDVKHLCSIPCVMKAAGKELEKFYGKGEIEP